MLAQAWVRQRARKRGRDAALLPNPASSGDAWYVPIDDLRKAPLPRDYNEQAMQLRSIITRFERLGLQRRIMLYVTGGLIVVMAAYSAVSLQAVAQSTNLVFRERLTVA